MKTVWKLRDPRDHLFSALAWALESAVALKSLRPWSTTCLFAISMDTFVVETR